MGQDYPFTVNVNGTLHQARVEPRRLAVDFLRDDLQLTGTHVGCGHGMCGACTVWVNGAPTLTCLMFAVQLDGAKVLTVEGLTTNGQLHPLQEAFIQCHGLQCGFCTPGVLLSSLHLLSRNPEPNENDIRTAISGNLCRCTGYVNIVRAIMMASDIIRRRKQEPVAMSSKDSEHE